MITQVSNLNTRISFRPAQFLTLKFPTATSTVLSHFLRSLLPHFVFGTLYHLLRLTRGYGSRDRRMDEHRHRGHWGRRLNPCNRPRTRLQIQRPLRNQMELLGKGTRNDEACWRLLHHPLWPSP